VRLLEQEPEPVDRIPLQVLCDVDVDGLGGNWVLVTEGYALDPSSDAQEWRRSWNRMRRTLVDAQSLSNSGFTFRGSIGVPICIVLLPPVGSSRPDDRVPGSVPPARFGSSHL
jgi:hypothetical protein